MWNGKKARTRIRRIKVGDWIVARREKKQFFLGYGKVVRGLYIARDSLGVRNRFDNLVRPFQERLDIEWYALPFPGLSWPDVFDRFADLKFPAVGVCSSEISRKAFLAVKRRLNDAGAIYSTESLPPTLWDRMGEPGEPAETAVRQITVRVRDPRNRLAAKKRARWKCEVPRCRIPIFLQQDTQRAYVEAHHLDPLADEGVEHLSNIAVVCAWHHALLTHGPEKEAKKVARQLKAVRAAEKKRR
jgi:hypothetical protein